MLLRQEFTRKDKRADEFPRALYTSEFPSLSNAPQTQHQHPGQAIWANANQRAIQPSSDHRSQQQNLRQAISQQQQPQNSQQGQGASQQVSADLFTNGAPFSGGFEDYRYGGQSGIGQLSGSGQPQPNSIEEFPPLGSGVSDEQGLDRRGSLIRNAAFDGFPNSNSYPMSANTPQTQHTGASANSGSMEGQRSSNLIDRVLSPSNRPFATTPSRAPNDNRQQHGNTTELDKDGMPSLRNNSQSSNTLFSSFQDSPQQGLPPIQQSSRHQQSSFGGSHIRSSSATPEHSPSQTSEMHRWGLGSLLSIMKGGDPDATGFAVGQDLTQLGLNLNSHE